MFFLAQMTRWIDTPDAGVFFDWSDCLQKHQIALSSILLLAMFLCGAAAFVLPLASELAAYRADENAYEAIAAMSFNAPSPSPMPIMPLPAPTGGTENGAEPAPLPGTESYPLAGMATDALASYSPSPNAPNPQQTASSSQDAQVVFDSGIDLEACLAQNKDFVAWLSIPGTVISYPVVRSDDSAYYLSHLFNGKKSKLGCLFSLKSSDYQQPSQNIAIYGHHLSHSDAMFSTLIDYKQEAYCAEHSVITLDSVYGRRSYRIFAVLNMKVSDWDPATASFGSGKAFLQFVNRAKRKVLYSTDVEVKEDDHILTLITCDRSYGGASGRLIVMAVQE